MYWWIMVGNRRTVQATGYMTETEMDAAFKAARMNGAESWHADTPDTSPVLVGKTFGRMTENELRRGLKRRLPKATITMSTKSVSST